MRNSFKRSTLDISTYDGYIVACALRGPDLPEHRGETSAPYAYLLKDTFTRRIRALAGVDKNRCFWLTRFMALNRTTAEGLQELLEALRGESDTSGLWHFLRHAAEAAEVLGDANLAKLAFKVRDSAAGTGPIPTVEEIIELAGGSD